MPPTGPRSHRLRRLAGTILLILIAGAAGCAPAVSNEVPTVEVNLDSLVAEAVETQRAETRQADENLSATLTEAAEQPLVLAAQTLTPTITPTPEATETPLPTIPTMELLPTFTPTPPGIPDRDPQDPALRLGAPDWTDTFDGSDNWSEFTGTNSQIEVRDGQLRYTIFEASAAPSWTVSWPQLSNFYLEVLARTPTACSGKDRLGVIFRAPDPEHGYRLEISCEGQYRMLVFDQSGAQTIVAWTSSEHLLTGPNQINRLGIWTEGKVIAIYLNGVNVAGLEHNDYRSGTFGFSVTSENTDNFTAAFDDLSFWSFP
jgi:hypothetical protein